MTVCFENPYAPRGEPIVFVTIENDLCVFVDAGSACKFFELRFADDVTIHRVNEVCMPNEFHRIWNVAFFVNAWISADFNDSNI